MLRMEIAKRLFNVNTGSNRIAATFSMEIHLSRHRVLRTTTKRFLCLSRSSASGHCPALYSARLTVKQKRSQTCASIKACAAYFPSAHT